MLGKISSVRYLSGNVSSDVAWMNEVLIPVMFDLPKPKLSSQNLPGSPFLKGLRYFALE
jgi:hypothetical protein